MRFAPILPAALLAVAVVLPACSTTRNDNLPPGATKDPVRASEYPFITVERPLQSFVAVDYDSILVDRSDGRTPMRVEVPVRSTAYEQMSVQHRFQWYDADGRHLKDDGWKFGSLEPGTQSIFKSNAVSLDAAQYRLEIRSAR